MLICYHEHLEVYYFNKAAVANIEGFSRDLLKYYDL